MGVMLDGYPTWSQNADPMPDGTSDPFAATDCGEECCSIVLYGQMRKYTTAGQIRQQIPGHAQRGETTAADLASYLTSEGLYPLVQQTKADGLKTLLKRSVANDMPCIALGHFLSPNVLHWVVVIGYGDDHCLYVDPWYGRLDAKHWSPFLSLCTGDVVQVGSRRERT